MKLRWSLLFLLACLPLTSNAEVFADSSGISGKAYFGVHAGGLRYEEEDYDANEVGAGLRVGYEFNNYFGLEGQLNAGLTNDDMFGVGSIGVDYLASFFVRGNIFLWDSKTRLYGLLGVTHGKITAEAYGISDSLTDTEMSYGLGIEFYGNSRNAINLEVIRYMDGEDHGFDYNVDGFNIGYIHRF